MNAFSQEDAEEGLIADPKLEIVEIRTCSGDSTFSENGEIVYEGNELVVLPFTEHCLEIVCQGHRANNREGKVLLRIYKYFENNKEFAVSCTNDMICYTVKML